MRTSRIGVRRKKKSKSPKHKPPPASESVMLMRRDLAQLSHAVEDQQYNMRVVLDRLNANATPLSAGPVLQQSNIPVRPPNPAQDYLPNTNTDYGTDRISNHTETDKLEALQDKIFDIADMQQKLLAKVSAHESVQVAQADRKDDLELIKREQRILTDHVGRLSQAVMELKTSKRSDALAAAAQIREQAEETMSSIRQEMQIMRKGITEYVDNMESRLSLLENDVQATIHDFRKEYDKKIKDLKI